MTVELIPTRLSVPQELASSMHVFGDSTARDIAYGFVAGWLSGQRHDSEDGKDLILLDNGFRLAMARSRRNGRDAEDNRVHRMNAAEFVISGIRMPMPALPVIQMGSGVFVHRGGMEQDGDSQQQWQVSSELSKAFRIADGQPQVDIPLSLLQSARNRWSVILFLRMQNWLSGGRDDKWVVDDRQRKLSLQVPVSDVLSMMGLGDTKVSEAFRTALKPAAAEISEYTGFRISITEKRTVYRARPGVTARNGKVAAFLIDIDIPLVQDPISYPDKRVPGSPWKPAPKFHRPAKPVEPAPADIADVVLLDEPEIVPLPRSNGFAGMRSVKLDDNDPDRIHSKSENAVARVSGFGMMKVVKK